MKLTGKWNSLMYPKIHGELTLNCNDTSLNNPVHEKFTAELLLVYSKISTYKPGSSITVHLEGVYEFDKIHRFILRQTEFNVSQYFTMTLNSHDKKEWQGFLTCICPVDCVKITDVKCQEAIDDKKDVIDEEFVITI